MSEMRQPGPLTAAYRKALADYKDLYARLEHDESEEAERLAAEAADLVEETREALLDADEEVEWHLFDGGVHFATVWASDFWEAREKAKQIKPAPSGEHETTWATWRLTAPDLDQSGTVAIKIPPPAPLCSYGRGKNHEWTADTRVVGGTKENPGVCAHGGRVTVATACKHCGCGRICDIWAQNPATGEQGIEAVRYEPDKYTEVLREFAEQEGDE